MVSHVTALSCTAEDLAEDVAATKKYYRYQQGKTNLNTLIRKQKSEICTP